MVQPPPPRDSNQPVRFEYHVVPLPDAVDERCEADFGRRGDASTADAAPTAD